MKKSGDSSNQSKILKTSPTVKASKNNRNILLNTKDVKYIDIVCKFKMLQKILTNKNIRNKLEDFLRSKQIQKSSTNTSNNFNSISSNHPSENYSEISYKTNQSESYLISTMKEFKIEKASRKFLINQKDPNNFQQGYKDFYTELFKIS